jgi:hypothetical protein
MGSTEGGREEDGVKKLPVFLAVQRGYVPHKSQTTNTKTGILSPNLAN